MLLSAGMMAYYFLPPCLAQLAKAASRTVNTADQSQHETLLQPKPHNDIS